VLHPGLRSILKKRRNDVVRISIRFLDKEAGQSPLSKRYAISSVRFLAYQVGRSIKLGRGGNNIHKANLAKGLHAWKQSGHPHQTQGATTRQTQPKKRLVCQYSSTRPPQPRATQSQRNARKHPNCSACNKQAKRNDCSKQTKRPKYALYIYMLARC